MDLVAVVGTQSFQGGIPWKDKYGSPSKCFLFTYGGSQTYPAEASSYFLTVSPQIPLTVSLFHMRYEIVAAQR